MNAGGPSDDGRPCPCAGAGMVGCFASHEDADLAGSLKLAGLIAARCGFYGCKGIAWEVRVTRTCSRGRFAYWFNPVATPAEAN